MSIFPLDDEFPVDEDVAAAEASLLAAAEPELEQGEAPEPFGRTPLFDFRTGRVVRAGASPVWVTGHDALKQWCLMVIHSARYAHAVFSDDFGMEDPESVIGEAADAAEAAGDYGVRLRDALLWHDRIADVEDFSASFVLLDGERALVYRFVVVTDEEERLEITTTRGAT